MAAIKMHLRYCSPCYIQKDGLLPPTELLLTGYVTQCYHHLDNGEAALPYTQRMAELVEGEYGVSSKGVCQNAGHALYDLPTPSCQLQHWPKHKPQCSVCFYCSADHWKEEHKALCASK